MDCSVDHLLHVFNDYYNIDITPDEYHLDHIKPVSKFDLSIPEELAKAFHWTNLQPLTAQKNLMKSNKWSDELEEWWRYEVELKLELYPYDTNDKVLKYMDHKRHVIAPDKFDKFCGFLSENPTLSVLSTADSLETTRKFSFQCKSCNQITDLTHAHFTKKMTMISAQDFCIPCYGVKQDKEKRKKIEGERARRQEVTMPPGKFGNFCKFLSSNPNLVVISTADSLKETKKISFQCKVCDEISEFAQTSFSNKMYKIAPEDFCATCFKCKKDGGAFEVVKQEILDKTGHVLLTNNFGGDRKCTYACGKCNTVHSTYINNLRRSTGVCPNCQNDTNRNDFAEIERVVTELGFVLDMRSNDYTNNKSLQVICKCGNSFKVALSDLNRGRMCIECKMDRCFDAGVKFRDYTFPSGRVVKIQGFEDKGLDYILSTLYKNPITGKPVTEDEIIVGKQIGCFKYTLDDKEHRYYPDIHIKDTNLYIEIKSTFTLNSKYDINMAKFKGMQNHGKCLQVLVFDNKGLAEILEYY